MQRARTSKAKRQRRQALLEAALDCFYQRGFQATRLEDIAEQAGVSKGTVYLYFDSKEQLFAGLIDHVALPIVEHIEQLAEHSHSLAAFLSGFRRFAVSVLSRPQMSQMMKILIGDGSHFPPLVEQYRQQVIQRLLGCIAGNLQAAQQRGEMIEGNAQLIAKLVVAPVVMSAIWQVVFATDKQAAMDLDGLFAEHENILYRALHNEEK